jgi:uncharacterized HAD superfamily protein
MRLPEKVFTKRRLGIDLDGVLCNFNDSYAAAITKYTGITFPKNSATWPTEWYWERAAGVTKEQESEIWKKDILWEGSEFWYDLDALPEAIKTCGQLNLLAKSGHEVLFLTNRAGHAAKYQTERWLYFHGVDYPTVILIADKAPLIRLLGIDFFIDDKPETIADVAWQAAESPKDFCVGGHIYLKNTAYNKEGRRSDVHVVESVAEALRMENLWQD